MSIIEPQRLRGSGACGEEPEGGQRGYWLHDLGPNINDSNHQVLHLSQNGEEGKDHPPPLGVLERLTETAHREVTAPGTCECTLSACPLAPQPLAPFAVLIAFSCTPEANFSPGSSQHEIFLGQGCTISYLIHSKL